MQPTTYQLPYQKWSIREQKKYINKFFLFLYYGIIFVSPFYKWRTLSEKYSFLKIDYILFAFLAIPLLINIVIQKKFFEYLKANIWKWWLLFVTVDLISTLLSPYFKTALKSLILLILITIYIALNILMITRDGFKRTLPQVLIWSVTITSITGIIAFVFKIEDWTTLIEVPAGVRAGKGVASSTNGLALMIVFIFPLICHWIAYAKTKFSRQLAIIVMVINFTGLVCTFSRSGFLCFNIILLFIVFQYKNRFQIRYFGLVLATFLTVIALAIIFVPKDYVQRQVAFLFQGKTDASIQRRSDYIPVAIQAFEKRPIIGTGLYTFKVIWVQSEIAKKFHLEERYAHNSYLDVLVGTGIIGLSLFLALILQCLSNFSKASRFFELIQDEEMASIIKAYRIAFISILLQFLVYSVIEHNFFIIGISVSATAINLAQDKLNELIRTQKERGCCRNSSLDVTAKSQKLCFFDKTVLS